MVDISNMGFIFHIFSTWHHKFAKTKAGLEDAIVKLTFSKLLNYIHKYMVSTIYHIKNCTDGTLVH